MNINGHSSRGRPKKGWMDCVKDNMIIKVVSGDDDGREWKKKTCCDDPTYWDNGMMKKMNLGFSIYYNPLVFICQYSAFILTS
jgi:hypothetical protein